MVQSYKKFVIHAIFFVFLKASLDFIVHNMIYTRFDFKKRGTLTSTSNSQ
mgnify:CR=1 FL=1